MRRRKALFSFLLFALLFASACSGGRKETNATDSKPGATSALLKEDLGNQDIAVPEGEKGIGSGNTDSSEGEVVGKGENLADKDGAGEVGTKAPLRKKNNITKTIMIYIVGSDLESMSGAASSDIIEMMDSGVDLSKTNVLIYTGGTSEWWIEAIPTNRNMVYELREDGFVPVKEQLDLNMGDSYTLESFLTYSKKNYPAEQFGLILWDHGGGPMFGYGVDEKANDLLEMSEIADALDDSGFVGEKKLEFLGFDACLMGAVETGWSVRDNAKYLIASQETEPGWGWDYSFLRELRYCADGADIGKEIIDSYMETGEAIFEIDPYYWSDLTLSCVDLTKIDALEDALDALYEEVAPDLGTGYFTKASRARTRTKTFGQFTTDTSYDLVDLGDMVTFLEADYAEEAEALQKALDEFVCYSKSNVADATGVSILYPYENRDYMSYFMDVYETFDFAPNYTEYLKTFTEMLKKPRSSAWSTMRSIQGTAVGQDASSLLTFQLTPEQAENYAYSQYVILKKVGEDEYVYAVDSNDTEIDDKGLISANYNNRIVFAVNNRTGEWSDTPLPMTQVQDGISKDRYTASAMLWAHSNVDTFSSFLASGEIQFILGETPEMYGIYPMSDEDNPFPAKNLLDYRDASILEVVTGARKPERDENGELQPYSRWSGNIGVYGTSLNVSDGFHFEYLDISGQDEYYYMFQVYDLQGNCTVSELFPLPAKGIADGKPVIMQESLMETERKDYANLIQGVTVKSAEAFGQESQITLSDKFEDFTFRLDGYTYELPMPLSHLRETGWMFYSWCDFDEVNLTPGDYVKAYMHKNGKTIQIEVYNPSGNNKKFKDCTVCRMSFAFPQDCELMLAQGTEADTISLDNVITLFGNPHSMTINEDGTQVTLRYNYGYSDSLFNDFICYEMSFSVETKQLESLIMMNYFNEETMAGKEDTEYLKGYAAPEKLGEDLLSYDVQLMGDVYSLPAPVSAFTANGWEVVLAQNVKAGKDLDKGVILKKDGVILECSVLNFAEYQTSAVDATIYKVVQRGNASGTLWDTRMVLPGDICLGMSEEVFLELVEKNPTIKEKISLYEYVSSYSGVVTHTYTYSESSNAGFQLKFLDGKLDEIMMYNRICEYRETNGGAVTKSLLKGSLK